MKWRCPGCRFVCEDDIERHEAMRAPIGGPKRASYTMLATLCGDCLDDHTAGCAWMRSTTVWRRAWCVWHTMRGAAASRSRRRFREMTGETAVTVATLARFQPGDRVRIMDRIGNGNDVVFTVGEVEINTITLDPERGWDDRPTLRINQGASAEATIRVTPEESRRLNEAASAYARAVGMDAEQARADLVRALRPPAPTTRRIPLGNRIPAELGGPANRAQRRARRRAS